MDQMIDLETAGKIVIWAGLAIGAYGAYKQPKHTKWLAIIALVLIIVGSFLRVFGPEED
jgi:hypothetical protein